MTTGEPAFTVGTVRRRILTGSAWVLGARVAGLGIGVVTNGLLARLLTPSEFGAFLLVSTMVVIGSTAAKMGLDRAVVRFTASSIGTERPGGARDALRIALGWGAVGAAGVSLVLALGAGQWFFADVLGQPLVVPIVPLAAGWLFALAMQSIVAESFRGMSRFGWAALFQTFATDLVTVVALGLVYLVGRTASLPAVVGTFAIVAAAVLAISGFLLLRVAQLLVGAGHVSRADMFHTAWPLLVTNLGIFLLGSGVDLWVLGAFRSDQTVALYGAASRLVVLVATPMIIFSGVIPPIVSELYAQGKTRQLERTLRSGAALAGIPAFAVLLILLVAGGWILDTVYGPYYRAAATILAILATGRLIAVWTGSCGIALMMTGHQRDMMRTTLVSGALSIVGGVIAAPRFGAVGVAVATASAQVVQNGSQLLLARRRLGIWTNITFSPREILGFFRGPRERSHPGPDPGSPPDAQSNGQISSP